MRINFRQNIKSENLEKNLKEYLWNTYGNYVSIRNIKQNDKMTKWEMNVYNIHRTSEFVFHDERYLKWESEKSFNIYYFIHQYLAINVMCWMKNKHNAKTQKVRNIEGIDFFTFFNEQYNSYNISYTAKMRSNDEIYKDLRSLDANVLSILSVDSRIFSVYDVVQS